MVYKMCNVPNSEWDVELLKGNPSSDPYSATHLTQ